jgi:hypothetical protein
MSEDSRIRNPTGKGGLAFRRGDRWRALFACGKVVSCSALAKSTGKRCRAPPVREYGVCRNHGGWGGRTRHRLPTSLRHLSNKSIKQAREYADRELDRRDLFGELHSELRQAFRDTDRSRLHPADESRLRLAIDDSLHGRLTAAAWRDTRKALGLDPPRPTPAPVVAPAPEPEQPQFIELWGRGAKLPNGW